MKRTGKILSLFFSVILLIISVLGCSGVEKEEKPEVKKDDTIRIGMSFDSFVIERWQRDRDVFVSTAKEYGAEVNVQNANGNIDEQKRQISYFIEEGMDVIVIICIDADALSDEVKKASDAGIKVIAYDRIIRDANVDLYISFDNKAVGTCMGEAIVNSDREVSNVVMISGSPADYNVPMVEEGFTEEMEKAGINILDKYHCDAWRAELASDYMYDNLDVIMKADAIMCGNDNIASRVVSVLAEQRKAGNILVVGQDADLEACQRIVEGTQLMTVYKPVDLLATRAAECAIAMAKGEDIGADSVINDGTYDVAYISLTPIPVSEGDMNEIIVKSGFHNKEDVYLNVPNKMPE